MYTKRSLPKYLSLGEGGTAVIKEGGKRYKRERYYRPAGNWYCEVYEEDGKLYANIIEPEDPPTGIECFEITEEQFKEDNSGYV